METAKDADKTPETDVAPVAPRRNRPIGKIVLFLLVPVVAGAGILAGTAYMGSEPEAPVPAAAETMTSIDLDSMAETSFVYSYTLAELLKPTCGEVETGALRDASDLETRDGIVMASRSQAAAKRRADTITTARSCNHVLFEIDLAEQRAKTAGF